MNKIYLMKGFLPGLVLLLVLSMGAMTGADAATVYVDHNNTSGIEDGSAASPFNTIQEGINAANLGDTVKVAPGTYTGDLTHFPQLALKISEISAWGG